MKKGLERYIKLLQEDVNTLQDLIPNNVNRKDYGLAYDQQIRIDVLESCIKRANSIFNSDSTTDELTYDNKPDVLHSVSNRENQRVFDAARDVVDLEENFWTRNAEASECLDELVKVIGEMEDKNDC